MKINTAEFVQSVADLAHLPTDHRPEIVFLGRSNVGKSTLINRLTGSSDLARSSTRPGKTRLLNYYRINKDFYFVDLPGYGYAKVPEHMRAGWAKLIETYLRRRKQIRLALQVIDLRHGATQLDTMMMGWLEYYRVQYAVVLTKADKVARSKLHRQVQSITDQLTDNPFLQGVIPFSAMTSMGKKEILSCVEAHLTFTD
ncbi:MAG: ribosome biogenesis GTP-binding protein YihA/YsxC [Bacteroidota bacterium]